MPAQPHRTHEPSAIKTIALATLVAGTLDIIAAVVNYYIGGGREPIKIFYFISSGVFGYKEALAGGKLMAIYGLLFHYILAFIFSFFLFIVYPYLKKLLKNSIIIGLLYGLFVWVVMNKIVLPLSNTPKMPFNWNNAIIAMLILMFMLGLPMALIMDKHYSKLDNGSYHR